MDGWRSSHLCLWEGHLAVITARQLLTTSPGLHLLYSHTWTSSATIQLWTFDGGCNLTCFRGRFPMNLPAFVHNYESLIFCPPVCGINLGFLGVFSDISKLFHRPCYCRMYVIFVVCPLPRPVCI